MYREEAGKSESKGSGARASKEPGSGRHCPAVSFRSLIKLKEMQFEASCKRVYICCLRANVFFFFFTIGEYNQFFIKKSELHDAAIREPS
jgi:hypothetical protein